MCSDDRVQKVGVIGKVMEYYRVEDLKPCRPISVTLCSFKCDSHEKEKSWMALIGEEEKRVRE